MFTAILSTARSGRRVSPLLAACLLLTATATMRAEDENDPGRVVTVPAPITPDTAGRFREAITDALHRAEPRRGQRVFKVVLDFNPDGRPNSSKDFGSCYELADFLRKLQGQSVRTIAFVHGEVTRHSVLPVFACSEIVFSKTGELGDVVRDPGETLDAVKRLAYDEVTRNRLPLALIRKTYDRDLVVVRAADRGGDRYRDAHDVKAGEPVLLAGSTARYTFAQAKAFGICQPEPRETVVDVALAYNLSRNSINSEPLIGRAPSAWLIPVDGPINGELRERLPRRVRRALGAKANLIIFLLRCHGGDSESAADLAAYLENVNKDRPDNPVRLVAYVMKEAADTAVFPALACGRIVMQSEAKLGGLDSFLHANAGREEVVRKNLEDLATRHSYPPLLIRALADGDLQLYRVIPTHGSGGPLFVSKAELDEDLTRPERHWKDEHLVKNGNGKCLTLDAETARSYGLADAVEDDVAAICQLEGVDPSQVHDATSDRDWLDDLANFLRDPWTSVVLVMVGITCLILELKMPGVSLPGIIAAICFVLFFWSHSQLNGQITWLALLLFVLGLMLIALEMFILPGVGVAGISGTVLVLGSLGLVAYGHWPRSNEEWIGFGRTLGPFGISVLGAMAAAFVLARFLPSLPFANRLILHPADEMVEFGEEVSDSSGTGYDFTGLLGAVGVSATPLRPAGKVQFGDEFVDVVAEGGYVPPGVRVQVVEIEGNRIVVKEV